jgi:lipopolysaccharide export system ATP-binding protein
VTAAPHLLEARGLRVSLGGRTVLDGADLAVGPGEVVGLLGPNGAGKTTLFRVLEGILPPEEGAVLLEGRDITALPVHLRARLGLGYLPQGPSAFLGLSVLDNLRAALELRGASRDRARALLEEFGLGRLAKQRASTLSGGERRRLELARLFATEPRVLLLDEPFKGLDARAAEDLRSKLRGFQAMGRGALLTDHDVSQALTICERAYILVNGRIVASGAPAEVLASPEAKRTYWSISTGLGPAEGDPEWHSRSSNT